MTINEPYGSLENCDISQGEVYHTMDCTCTAKDLDQWYKDKAEVIAEMQTDNYADHL